MIAEEVLNQYGAVKSGAGWRNLSEKQSRFAAVGPDRIAFLHALLSNDIESLEAGHGVYTTLLTPTGKIISDFYCYRLEEKVLIDVRADLAGKLIPRLRGYIIMDDVELSDFSTEHGHVSIQGTEARALVTSILGTALDLSALQYADCSWEGSPVALIRKDELSIPGFEVLLPAADLPPFLARLQSLDPGFQVREVGDEAYNVLRLERGIPLYGIDMSERNNPLEAGLRDSYSLTKGCFVGQEVVAKATNIGGVARLLRRIRCREHTIPDAGSKILSSEGQEWGWITSACYSPGFGYPIAMGYLKRAHSAPGTECIIESASGRMNAVLVEEFN